MEETSLKHTHAVKLSSGQRSVEESKQFCGSLPLSIKSPREVPNYFLDNDWERVKKGKTWIIWQSLSLPAKTKLSLKQHNVAGSIGPCVPWLLSTWEPQSSCRAWQLQMLHTSYWDTHLKNSPAVSNGTIFPSPPSWTAFSGNKGTTPGKKNAWPNNMFRAAAPRYEEPVCLYVGIKYFLHYTTNPINSFRKLWNVIIQGVPFIKGLRLFLYRGCILPTGNKAGSRIFSQGRIGPDPHHAEVGHPLTIHISVKQASQEKNQPFLPLQRAPHGAGDHRVPSMCALQKASQSWGCPFVSCTPRGTNETC